mmetsp:Transcript_66108/g.149229  ORF Transcript_66108/g.149229 Transcript_66108/m.149229 type:complete len:243 (-) Transcript_66108:604-1332(-)
MAFAMTASATSPRAAMEFRNLPSFTVPPPLPPLLDLAAPPEAMLAKVRRNSSRRVSVASAVNLALTGPRIASSAAACASSRAGAEGCGRSPLAGGVGSASLRAAAAACFLSVTASQSSLRTAANRSLVESHCNAPGTAMARSSSATNRSKSDAAADSPLHISVRMPPVSALAIAAPTMGASLAPSARQAATNASANPFSSELLPWLAIKLRNKAAKGPLLPFVIPMKSALEAAFVAAAWASM